MDITEQQRQYALIQIREFISGKILTLEGIIKGSMEQEFLESMRSRFMEVRAKRLNEEVIINFNTPEDRSLFNHVIVQIAKALPENLSDMQGKIKPNMTFQERVFTDTNIPSFKEVMSRTKVTWIERKPDGFADGITVFPFIFKLNSKDLTIERYTHSINRLMQKVKEFDAPIVLMFALKAKELEHLQDFLANEGGALFALFTSAEDQGRFMELLAEKK
jgi:hypothetical protein